MKNASQQTLSAFYHRLGYLFYAIAAADRHVKKEEINALHEMVKEDWMSLESSTDDFGTDAAYQIEITFDMILERELTSEKAFEEFEEWYHTHASLFDAEVIRKIHHTVARIAHSFHEANKAELAMMYRVKSLLGGGLLN